MIKERTRSNVISFGSYLLSDERKERYGAITQIAKENGFNIEPTEERLKEISHADVFNWENGVDGL